MAVPNVSKPTALSRRRRGTGTPSNSVWAESVVRLSITLLLILATGAKWHRLLTARETLVSEHQGQESSKAKSCRQSDQIRKTNTSKVVRSEGRDRTRFTIRGAKNACLPPLPTVSALPLGCEYPSYQRNTLRKFIQSLLIDPSQKRPRVA